MKQIFTTLLLLTAAIISANAEMRTVWTGTQEIGNWNWDTRLELPATNFATLAYGEQMVITMEQNTEDAGNEQWFQYEIIANDYVEGRNPERTSITSGDLNANGDVEITLTNEQVDLIRNYGLIVNGHFVTITNIAIGTEAGGGDTPDEGTTTELWSGSTATGSDWSGYVDLSYDNRGELANAKIGDVITVTFTIDGENGHVQIANPDGWIAYDTNSSADVNNNEGSEQTFAYEIPDATILYGIQKNGIITRGHDITITKVELTTYPDSYDAVAVTIGTEGIATYSKSDKSLDFTGTAVKAYYASAVGTGRVTLTPISQVPEYTGIIVKGEPGTYEIPVIDDIDGLGTNYLKAIGDWEQQISASAEGASLYIFNESDVTFSLVAAGTTVEANKAYLETPTDITPAEGSIELEFEDEGGTGINNIEIDKTEDDNYYNLQGMRVEHPTRGIYIHNGKKVIIR